MKKTIVSILVSLVVVLSMTTIVKAATANEVVNYLKSQGGSYVSNSNIVELERFFKENPITSDEGDQLIAKIDEAKAIVDSENVNDIEQFSSENKSKLKSVLISAAAVVDVDVSFDGDKINFYKDGKLISSVSISEINSNGTKKLAYTGNKISVVAISAVAIIALAIVGIKVENAK